MDIIAHEKIILETDTFYVIYDTQGPDEFSNVKQEARKK